MCSSRITVRGSLGSSPMAPSASILFPTRRRRDYLAVALASVAPQAAAHGAEIVVNGHDHLYDRYIEHYDDASGTHRMDHIVSGGEYGWVGRLADSLDPKGSPNYLVNIDETQSLAVRSERPTPVAIEKELAYIVAGLDRADTGEMHVFGKKVRFGGPSA